MEEDDPQRSVSDPAASGASTWEDIHSELSCSSREVCLGYGSLASTEAIRRQDNGERAPASS